MSGGCSAPGLAVRYRSVRWCLLIAGLVVAAGCASPDDRPLGDASNAVISSPVTTKSDESETFDEMSATPDLVLVGRGFQGLDPSIADDVANRAEFTAVSPVRGVTVTTAEQPWTLIGVSPAEFAKSVELGLTEGSFDDLAGSGVLIAQGKADELGVGVADDIRVENGTAEEHTLTVAGIYSNDTFGTGIIDLKSHEVISGSPLLDLFVVAEITDRVDEADARNALAETVDLDGTVQAQWLSDFLASYPNQAD